MAFWLAGIAFLWAWSFSFVLSPESVISAQATKVADVLYLGSSLIAACWCTFVLGKGRSISQTVLMKWATGFLLVASVLIVWGEYVQVALVVWLGKVLGGPGQVCAWIAWTYEISKFDLEDIELSFLGWMVLLAAFLGISTVVVSLPGVVKPILRSLLLLGCAVGSYGTFCHVTSLSVAGGGAPAKSFLEGDNRNKSRLQSVGWLFCCLGLTLAACCVVSAVSQQLFALEVGLVRLVYSGAAFAMLPVAWLVLHLTRQFGPGSLYRWSVPVVVVGTVLYLLLPSSLFVLPAFALALVTIGFESLYHLLFIYAAKRFAPKGQLVASIGVLTVTVGGVGGSLVVGLVPHGQEGLLYTFLISVAVFVVLASITPRTESMSGLLLGRKIEACETGGQQSHEVPEDVHNRFAEKYGLTSREKEVLELLMRGRSRTFIRETLFISKGTVDTHINHIYKKAGVRSKEELERLMYEETKR